MSAVHRTEISDRLLAGTYTRKDVLWLAESNETLADELNELIEACFREHHVIATRGPRKGLTVHSDCAICEWLSTHPVRA